MNCNCVYACACIHVCMSVCRCVRMMMMHICLFIRYAIHTDFDAQALKKTARTKSLTVQIVDAKEVRGVV
jgi:hypothetical protein